MAEDIVKPEETLEIDMNEGEVRDEVASEVFSDEFTNEENIAFLKRQIADLKVWDELYNSTLTSSSATISGNISKRKHLRFICFFTITGGSPRIPTLKFNSDSGSNYNSEFGTTAYTSTAGMQIVGLPNTSYMMMSFDVINIASKLKVLNGTQSSNIIANGTVDDNFTMAGSWENTTDQITSFEFSLNYNSYDTDSSVLILGRN